MAKHEYKIKAVDGKLYCFKDGVEVHDWQFLKGERMPEMKLFIDGVGVATRGEIIWEGLTDKEYNNLRNGVEIPNLGVLWSRKDVNPVTGETTITAERDNGDIVITVLDKEMKLVADKCVVKKAQ